MKKQKIVLFLFLVFPSLISAQSLVNNGAAIIIKNGSAIKLKGDYINQQNGRIKNAGTFNLDGDWIQNSTAAVFLPATGGQVKITGLSTHMIGGSYYPVFPSLKIESNVYLDIPTFIGNQLDISLGSLRLTNNDLVLLPGISFLGGNMSHYITTDGTGSLQMSVEASPKIFPVGTISSYAPVTIKNNSVSDNFRVNLIGNVLSNGSSGTTIPQINDCVKLTWNVDPEAPGTANYDITAQWNAIDEGPGFDRSHSAIGAYHTGNWNSHAASAASGTNPFTLALTNNTNAGSFAVGDTESPMAIILNILIDIKAFLEGSFDGAEMYTLLNDNNHLPLNQPYNIPPWNFPGTESVAAIPNNQVVDWVLVDWRDAPDAASATESTRFARQVAFLLNDGNIVGLDGSSKLSYNYTLNNNLFVVIWHRNHLPIMSANPLTESGGIYSYDFTSSASQAYGNNQNNLGAAFGMIGGNGDASNTVDMGDKTNVWMIKAGLKGYLFGDYTMDGQVNNQDKNDIWVENFGKTSVIP